MHCVFCDTTLGSPAARPAFDPWLGRLWRVCPSCARWNVVPLEDRWETLEDLERLARDCGRSRLRTEHLDLVDVPGGQLIRVGRAPRPELAGWRYGDRVPPAPPRGLLQRLQRMILGMPTSPLGYDGGYGALLSDRSLARRWFASPFLDDAPTLTAAFLHVPLAAACPACAQPLAVAPWNFQALRLTAGAGPGVVTTCAWCQQETLVPLPEARPALRLGLSIVNRRLRATPMAEAAGTAVDRAAGPEGMVRRISGAELTLGDLRPVERLALGQALDEQTEAEVLEREWREAEELAGIVDGQLTAVDGFDELRDRVLRGGADAAWSGG